ncbi:hypothetical protein VHEMI08865 [[Torrubiella] hemipterigena]|uniref:Uncharacterized protein n=1 Tax=[Torrubiella] hemipterigena TaxID=1531966 RepID=A0A0A1TP05_9HYPO|nr:hypothetical protein VHEMI08865 [[Torrubiella] hemipterigena]
MAVTSQTTYPGDDVVPDAAMVYNRRRIIRASKEDIFPWLVQLGKGRGGWYMSKSCERFVSKSSRATRQIHPEWQNLQPGMVVEDYGFGKEEFVTVSSLSAPDSLVYVADRYGTRFTWALLLKSISEEETEVHLRFRGQMEKTGLAKKMIVRGGDVIDWAFTEPLLTGLAERVEKGC